MDKYLTLAPLVGAATTVGLNIRDRVLRALHKAAYHVARNSGVARPDDCKAKGTDMESQQVSVFDVAACILNQKDEMGAMKLHKILYYCQAWSLVWDDKPLFRERIEAWVNGPVVRRLYAAHRREFSVSADLVSRCGGNAECLSPRQRETVDAVVKFYGDRDAQWLSDLTHSEAPWQNARAGVERHQRSQNEISLASMAEFYSSLAKSSSA